jgi:hypothetical protein
MPYGVSYHALVFSELLGGEDPIAKICHMLEQELTTIVVTEHKDLILSCEFSEIFLNRTINLQIYFFRVLEHG